MPSNDASTQDRATVVTDRPFTTFNFRVKIEREDQLLCKAAFSECDGLEMTMEPKTHQEGGNNVTQYQMVGPVSYGQLTLKRGMTKTFDLWNWFNAVNRPDGYGDRSNITVEMLALGPDDEAEGEASSRPVNARFQLFDCLPVKLRAPSLAAGDGGVAVEELQVAYERMKLKGEAQGEESNSESG